MPERFEQQENGDWWRIVERNGREVGRFYRAAEQIVYDRKTAKLVDYKGDIIDFTGQREGLDFVNGFATLQRTQKDTPIREILDRLRALEDKIDQLTQRQTS